MAKQANKTNPIGVRFNKNKLELVQKEKDLSTPQKVIDYFLDGYGEENELEKKLNEIWADQNGEENTKKLLYSLMEIGIVITEHTEQGCRVLLPETPEWWKMYDEFKGKKSEPIKEEKNFPKISDEERKLITTQMEEIRNEKVPSHRDTKLGRVSWQQEQWKRIAELEAKLTP